MKNKTFWLFKDFNIGECALFDNKKALNQFVLDYTADFLKVGLIPDSEDYRIKEIELNIDYKRWAELED